MEMAQKTKPLPEKLGTFGGVFTPSILTILGIILFLRLGFVVGNAGLLRALVIIGIANTISVLTSLSLSAISTNIRVKVGGVYYLISRTLGLEFGGAIGIVMFLAQSVSIAFYCIGFGEILAVILSADNVKVFSQLVAAASILVLFSFAWLGADWATRFQYVVMAVLGAALVSFFVGGLLNWNTGLLLENWSAPEKRPPFWLIFAIFFPAVTGFTQGSSMSGDLKDPGKSLPLGTLLAVGISIVVYFGAAVLLAGSVPNTLLTSDYTAMKRVSLASFLIDAGVIAATLSSAMASFLGAPRILQSLAADRVFPFLAVFAKGYGINNNPRRGVILSACIALLTVGLGNLNLVAPVVSMFFLISYGLLNYATYFEASAQSPSFRPRFKFFHRRLSLAGALACMGVMLAIDPFAGFLAMAVLFAVYQYLKRTAGPSRWADSQRSYHLQRIREHLMGLAEDPEHARDWRPHILALSNDSERRPQLLRAARWMEGNSGLTTVVKFVEGGEGPMLRRQREAEKELREDLKKHGSSAFSRVIAVPEAEPALSLLVQAYGVGPVKVNTLMMNWYSAESERDYERRMAMNRIILGAYRLGCNLLICNFNEKIETGEPEKDKRRIDIWWQGDATGKLSLLLAFLMKRDETWEDAQIRVMTAETRHRSQEGLAALKEQIHDARIEAELEVLKKEDLQEVIQRSAHSDLVFLPFRFQGRRILSLFGARAAELLRWLSFSVLIQAAEDIDLSAEPESGEAAQRAEVLDALEEIEKKAKKATDDARQAEKKAQEARQQLSKVKPEAGPDADEKTRDLKDTLEEAREEAETARRKAAKAEAKRAAAEKEAIERGLLPPEEEDSP